MDTSKPWDWGGVSLLPSLILYQNRRDAALRLARPSRQTRALLAVYLARRQADLAEGQRIAGQLGRAAFLRGVVSECRAEMGRLIEAADTPEKRQAALDEALHLNALAERAAAELEAIAHE